MRLLLAALMAASLSVCASHAPGGVQSMNPAADTFVSGANSTSAYGGAGALEVSAPGLANGEFQSIMKFNLAVAKTAFDTEFGTGLWSVQSATLQLTSANPNNAIFNANATGAFNVGWMQNDSWLEGAGTPASPTASPDLTFSLLPGLLSGSDQSLGSFASPGTNSGSNTFTLTLASNFVADLLAGGDVSLRVFADSGSTSSYLFNSRSFGTAGSRPLLTITAVPEPSAILFGLPGLMLLRRRRF